LDEKVEIYRHKYYLLSNYLLPANTIRLKQLAPVLFSIITRLYAIDGFLIYHIEKPESYIKGGNSLRGISSLTRLILPEGHT
jgi:hypothetical protein